MTIRLSIGFLRLTLHKAAFRIMFLYRLLDSILYLTGYLGRLHILILVKVQRL